MIIRQHVTCWLCQWVIDEVYWEKLSTKRAFNTRYVRCKHCGLVMVSPFVSDPYLSFNATDSVNYVNNIDLYTGAISNDALRYLAGKMEQKYTFLTRKQRGHVLEVGCAAGYFLFTLQARDWIVQGVELGDAIASWGQKYLHVPIHIGPIESAPLNDAEFDVVVAVEVLEHVISPKKFIASLWSKLKPGGVLFLTTPNVYSSAYYPPDSSTAILEPTDHLNLFSEDTLRQLITLFPFDKLEIELDGPNDLQLQLFARKDAASNTLLSELFVDTEFGIEVGKEASTLLPFHVVDDKPGRLSQSKRLKRRVNHLLDASKVILREQGIFPLLQRIILWLSGERRHHRN